MICTPTQQTYTVGISLWRQRYCDANRQAQAFLAGQAPCAGKIILEYRHPSESQVAFTAAQRFEIAGVVLEPVTARNAPDVYNPAGIAFNALAAFEIEVYPTTIPNADITWNIAYGDIWFYNTGNKGRTVYVRGGTTEGDFKLEVDIANMTLDPKPHIYGRVVEPKVIPLYVFNICDTNGVPALTTERINEMVSTANSVYKQAGMRFYIANLSTITNQDWFRITNNDKFYEMTSYTNNVGGLEIYCVDSLPFFSVGKSSPNSVAGYPRGIAVSAQASQSIVLAHEIGHACWLYDIFFECDERPVSQTSVGDLNWSGGDGTGYYRQEATHAFIVKRLLMYGRISDVMWDIPVSGIEVGTAQFNSMIIDSRPVGLSNMIPERTPQH